MIVVDTNVIAYLFIPGEHTLQARNIFKKDPEWAAPLLWRSELRNILTYYQRSGHLAYGQALELMSTAEFLMEGGEYAVSSSRVLTLTEGSRCSAYDCEFVALAQELNLPLVTSDARILKEFPATAISIQEFSE